jgi:4-amino-4-deoxy-L-arabinose transferase-like glycosyltransferase
VELHRRLLLAAIALLALALRLWGIRWGAPARIDLHPDEIDYVIKYAQVVSRHNLDPGFLNYPAFMMYLTSFSAALLRRLGLLHEIWQIHVVGRLWSALFGVGTVAAIYPLARELGGRAAAALLAALWVALLPLHVWESHVAVTDVAMTFWLTLTLFAAVRLLRRDGWRDWAFAGAALGLATGSKYTAALATAAILLAALLAGRPVARTARGVAIAGACALGACFVVAPYSFLHLQKTLAAMAFESRHTMGHHYGFSIPADGWQYRRYLYQFVAAWPFSCGVGLYASVVAGTLWAVRRADRRLAVVLGFAALFFGVTGSWNLTPLRYYLPLLVVGALFAGLWQGAWLAAAPGLRRGAALAAIVLALGYTSVFSWQTTRRYSHETRIEAARWLESRQPAGSLLGLGDGRYLAQPLPGSKVAYTAGRESDLKDLQKLSGFDLVEVSSLVYRRHYRHGDRNAMPFYDRLGQPASGLRLVKRFAADFPNKTFYEALDPMFEGYFLSPTLEFYEPIKRPSPVF